MKPFDEFHRVAPLFWAKVEKTDGCWLWKAARDADGYGKFQVQIKGANRQEHIPAHRYSLALALGRRPLKFVLHSCDEPSCVRPEHLSEGTQSDNIKQAYARGRATAPRFLGSKHPRAKLNEALVAELRRRNRAGESAETLAKEIGASPHTVGAAISGMTWQHVSEAPSLRTKQWRKCAKV